MNSARITNRSVWPAKLKEACGVFGIYALGEDVARLTFFGLYALQHRGQESAGIAVSDGRTIRVHKAMGLVAQVFTEDNLRSLRGHLAIGHNRYSTTGSSRVCNAQPFLVETVLGPLAVAHNGNLTNATSLRWELLQRGVGLSSSSDTEVITQMLAGARGDTWDERLQDFMRRAQGAYSLTVLTRQAMYAVRDPWGFRPLCVGRLNDSGWVAASETCALTTIGAEYVREVRPGEIIRFDEDGMMVVGGVPPAEQQALCVFEYIYFARPDSLLNGLTVHRIRRRLGARLAREHPVDADMVMGVPDSATAHAIGYAWEARLPFGEGLMKNRYIGRTFIQPDDRIRRIGVRLKYNPLAANLHGKRVVLVDDSVVRGNTIGPMIRLLREGGATEVHVRVSSPPVRHPCFMGIDMATHEELIAHRCTVEEIRQHIGADTLAYLSHEGLQRAVLAGIGADRGHCSACFTGRYPIPLDEWWVRKAQEKLAFEEMWG